MAGNMLRIGQQKNARYITEIKTNRIHLYRRTVHFAESLDWHTNQCTHLNCLH